MSTTKTERDYVVEQLNLGSALTSRPMMGEYLLYYNNILFGGIYDGVVLIKKVEENKKYHLEEAIPYQGAKAMYDLETVEDKNLIEEIIDVTCQSLVKTKNNKKK